MATMCLHGLERDKKIVIIGRLKRHDAAPTFNDRFDGVNGQTRLADCDIAELSKTLQ